MKNLNLTVKEEGIGWLEWNQADSPVNLMSRPLIEELAENFQKAEKDKLKALVLLSKKDQNFCAGADIREIQNMQSEQSLRAVLNQVHDLFCWMEQLDFLKIAAIEGACLGGGLELVLCFDCILLSDSPQTRLALPEVRLGLIPGFGGCLRLPRKLGLRKSLDMILSGKSLNSRQAFKLGLAEERVPSLVLEKRALELAKSQPADFQKKKYRVKKQAEFLIDRTFKNLFCLIAKKQILKKTKAFYPAPLTALKVIRKTYGSSLSKKHFQKEMEAFCKVFQSPESKSLIHIWDIMTTAQKTKTTVQAGVVKPIKKAAVLGAGVMGRSIAFLFADKGFSVRLIDIEEQSLCSAIHLAKSLWKKQKQRRKINAYEMEQKMNRLSVSTKLWGLSDMDLVIEALPESKQLKQNVIQDISKKLKPSCLLASNTSFLSISELAKSSVRPENVFGLHFFNPAHRMPLVEVILNEEQKNSFLEPVKQALKKLGKTPLIVKDSPGFVVNRILAEYLIESLLLFEEGCEIEKIDWCYRDSFGLMMGPFQLMDKIGLDICLECISQLKSTETKLKTPEWTQQLTQTLGLGEKSGEGFYSYKGKKIQLNEKTKELKRNKSSQVISNETIIKRGIYRMINEGQRLIKNQIVDSEQDIDLAFVLGAGFPPFLGGPMHYAKYTGLSKIRSELEELSRQYGTRFNPHL